MQNIFQLIGFPLLHSKNQFSEAFEIAQDIADYDLFMDLYNLTKCIASLSEFAQVAFGQAAAIIHGDHQGNLSLTLASELRPDSACSQLSYTTPSPQTALKNYVPPLPSFKSKIFNAEMIKINIPKPELRPALMELRAPKLSGPTTNTSTKGGSHSAAKQTTLNGRWLNLILIEFVILNEIYILQAPTGRRMCRIRQWACHCPYRCLAVRLCIHSKAHNSHHRLALSKPHSMAHS